MEASRDGGWTTERNANDAISQRYHDPRVQQHMDHPISYRGQPHWNQPQPPNHSNSQWVESPSDIPYEIHSNNYFDQPFAEAPQPRLPITSALRRRSIHAEESPNYYNYYDYSEINHHPSHPDWSLDVNNSFHPDLGWDDSGLVSTPATAGQPMRPFYDNISSSSSSYSRGLFAFSDDISLSRLDCEGMSAFNTENGIYTPRLPPLVPNPAPTSIQSPSGCSGSHLSITTSSLSDQREGNPRSYDIPDNDVNGNGNVNVNGNANDEKKEEDDQHANLVSTPAFSSIVSTLPTPTTIPPPTPSTPSTVTTPPITTCSPTTNQVDTINTGNTYSEAETHSMPFITVSHQSDRDTTIQGQHQDGAETNIGSNLISDSQYHNHPTENPCQPESKDEYQPYCRYSSANHHSNMMINPSTSTSVSSIPTIPPPLYLAPLWELPVYRTIWNNFPHSTQHRLTAPTWREQELDPEAIRRRIDQGIQEKKVCRITRARSIFVELAVEYSSDIQVWQEFCRLEMECGEYLNARAVLITASKQHPHNELILQKRLRVEERLRSVNDVISLINELRTMDTQKSIKIMVEGIGILAKLGYEQMAMEYSNSFTPASKYYTGNLYCGNLLHEQRSGRRDRLLAKTKDALSIFPKYGPLWFFCFELFEHTLIVEWNMKDMLSLIQTGIMENFAREAHLHLTADLLWKVYLVRMEGWFRSCMYMRTETFKQVCTNHNRSS